MIDLKEFEKSMCKNCKYNNKKDIDKCEIVRSRLDNHLFCINFEKLDNSKTK